MDDRTSRRRNVAASEGVPPPGGGWPAWARRLASVLIFFHLAALLAGATGRAAPFASPLQQAVADAFAPYYGLVDQGHTYSFYAPEPPPTPVVTATLRFGDGRPEERVRLPDCAARPRLRYQRQLALAFWLFRDFEAARRESGEGRRSRWAQAYARHLCRTRPGCEGVTLHAHIDLIPDPRRVRESLRSPGSEPLDFDAEEFYTIPERIGDFPCDAS